MKQSGAITDSRAVKHRVKYTAAEEFSTQGAEKPAQMRIIRIGWADATRTGGFWPRC
jgi:hypothetical protein